LIQSEEPMVLFRSTTAPEWNTHLEMVELLTFLNSRKYALEVLRNLQDNMDGFEPGVKLYLAVLAERLQDPIIQFQVIYRAIADHPTLISESTLKLFYPYKPYEEIW